MAHFICLANSKKYTERCIAGIALSPTKNSYNIVKDEDKPVWVRPISDREHGEVDSDLVKDISLLDVVEIEIIEECPQGFQSENVYFNPNSIRIAQSIRVSPPILDKLLSIDEDTLFGNTVNRISEEEARHLGYSLIFIKVQGLEFYDKKYDWGKLQLRGIFNYNEEAYDLPVTDISFPKKYRANLARYQYGENIYLTVSLGVLFKGYHYKLIAGVVECP